MPKTYGRKPRQRRKGKFKTTRRGRAVRTGGATRRKTRRERGRSKKSLRAKRPTRNY